MVEWLSQSWMHRARRHAPLAGTSPYFAVSMSMARAARCGACASSTGATGTQEGRWEFLSRAHERDARVLRAEAENLHVDDRASPPSRPSSHRDLHRCVPPPPNPCRI